MRALITQSLASPLALLASLTLSACGVGVSLEGRSLSAGAPISASGERQIFELNNMSPSSAPAALPSAPPSPSLRDMRLSSNFLSARAELTDESGIAWALLQLISLSPGPLGGASGAPLTLGVAWGRGDLEGQGPEGGARGELDYLAFDLKLLLGEGEIASRLRLSGALEGFLRTYSLRSAGEALTLESVGVPLSARLAFDVSERSALWVEGGLDPILALIYTFAGPDQGATLWGRGRLGVSVMPSDVITLSLWGGAERAPIDLGERLSMVYEARFHVSVFFGDD